MLALAAVILPVSLSLDLSAAADVHVSNLFNVRLS